jgi:hypothetical protein
VRYRFGSPPTDSDPWQAFTSLSIPSEVEAGDCVPLTLYTQVRNTQNGQVQEGVSSATIVVDRGVQAGVLIQPKSAPVGDDDYIREPKYTYKVFPEPATCAGVKSYRATDTNPSDPPHPGSDSSSHEVTIPLDLPDEGSGHQEGDVTATVVVTDSLDSVDTVTKVLHYDDDPPQVVSGTNLGAVNDDGDSAIATLNFSNTVVTDDSYGTVPGVPNNKEYWGIWVLVSGKPLNNPTEQDFANHGGAISVIRGAAQVDVSLIGEGIPEDGKTMKDFGPRYIYLRFLDGAGNPSALADILTEQMTLNEGYTRPTLYLPIIGK